MAEYPCKVDGCLDGPFTRIADLRAHSKAEHGEDLSPRDKTEPMPESPVFETAEVIAPTEVVDAKPPTVMQRVKDRVTSATEEKPAKRGRKPKTVKVRGQRQSLAKGISGGWRRVGNLLVNSGMDIPVGRALVYQSPRVGPEVDALISGTLIDRAIQPLARKGEQWASVANLLLLPALVGAYERTGSPFVEQALRSVLEEHLEAMVPIIRQQIEDESKRAQLVRDMGLDPGEDAIGAILHAMFAQPAGAGVDGEAAPAPNGQGEHVVGGVVF